MFFFIIIIKHLLSKQKKNILEGKREVSIATTMTNVNVILNRLATTTWTRRGLKNYKY